MEQNKNGFIIDVLNILPEKIECFIQAPSLENLAIKEMLQKSDFDYFDLLILMKIVKEYLLDKNLRRLLVCIYKK